MGLLCCILLAPHVHFFNRRGGPALHRSKEASGVAQKCFVSFLACAGLQ
jgi:hypothetical protein